MRLVLRSKKVLTRIEEYQSGGVNSNSLLAWNGQLLVSKRTVRVYDYVYDERQSRALDEARELARRTGLALEVTDLTREGLLGRILRSGRGLVASEPHPVPLYAAGSKETPVERQKIVGVSSPVCQP